MKVRVKSRESIMELDSTVRVNLDGSFSCADPKLMFSTEMFYLFGKTIEVERHPIKPHWVVERSNGFGFWHLVDDWVVPAHKPKLSYSKGDKYE